MSKIYVFVGPGDAVNWNTTKSAIAQFAATFADGFQNFGAGDEATSTCPGCNRNLPLALFSVDHIKPQHRYTPASLGTVANENLVLIGTGCDRINRPGGSHASKVEGGVMLIQSGSKYAPKLTYVQSSVLWQNDLRNLQFLCPICNSSKGGKTWVEWGRQEHDAHPLSAQLKTAGFQA